MLVSIIPFLLTLFASLANKNTLLTSIIRSFYSYAVVFLFVTLVRWGLAALLAKTVKQPESEVNLVTPDDPELLELLKPEKQDQAEFEPLSPKKLVSTEKWDAQVLADAVRSLTDEEEK